MVILNTLFKTKFIKIIELSNKNKSVFKLKKIYAVPLINKIQ